MIGGYILIDLAGTNLTLGGEVSGLYDRCVKAIGTQKPVIFTNTKKTGIDLSPVSAALAYSAEGIYYFTAAGDNGLISSDGTITPADTENRTAKSKK
jgi:hypothetical protein